MRLATFPTYPKIGDVANASNYAELTNAGTSISVTSGANDKWAFCQLFALADQSATINAEVFSGLTISPTPVWSTIPIQRSGKNLYDETKSLLAGRWISAGAPDGIGNTQRKHTYLIPIIGGLTYAWSTKIAADYKSQCVWFDDTMTELSRTSLASGTISSIVTAPNTAKFVSLSVYNVTGQQTQFELSSIVTTYESYSGSSAEYKVSDGTIIGELTTTLGTNYIFAVSGSANAIYRADTTMYIQKLLS